jgi:hypothetical protein
MINYTNLNDAWGIMDEKETFKNYDNKKEIYEPKKKEVVEKLTNKINSLNEELNTLKNKNRRIEHMSNQIVKLNKEIKLLKNKKNIEGFTNKKSASFESLIEGFEFKIKPNKHLIVYLTILFMVIISILLIHSFRKPIEFETSSKNMFIFPEDLKKLKQLIDIAKLN